MVVVKLFLISTRRIKLQYQCDIGQYIYIHSSSSSLPLSCLLTYLSLKCLRVIFNWLITNSQWHFDHTCQIIKVVMERERERERLQTYHQSSQPPPLSSRQHPSPRDACHSDLHNSRRRQPSPWSSRFPSVAPRTMLNSQKHNLLTGLTPHIQLVMNRLWIIPTTVSV